MQRREDCGHFSPRALDWRYPREVMKPPSRLLFNVWQMNSTVKRSRCSSMNWIISDVVGRVLTRKKPMRLSITRWCREALDSHGATWLPLQRGLRAKAQQLGFRGERPVSIAGLCAMTRPTSVPQPGTRHTSKGSLPECGLLRDGLRDPSHPGQISLAYSRFSHLLRRNKTWGTSLGQ